MPVMQAEINLQEKRSSAQAPTYMDAKAQAEVQMMFRAQTDPEWFGEVYQTHYPMIYAYCRRRSGSREEAEDICSQVFIRAMKGVHTFRGGLVAAWLYRIARNEIATYYRKKRYSALPIDDYDVADDEQDFREAVESETSRQALAELVNQLPQEQRDLLSMSLVQGLTSPQIAQRLHQNPITVRTRLRRIKQSLQTRYRIATTEPARNISA